MSLLGSAGDRTEPRECPGDPPVFDPTVVEEPDVTEPARRGGARLSRGVSFWFTLVVLSVVLGGSAVVSPLYGVYERDWRFTATTLTAVFAVYAIAVLVVLLFAGSLSDHLGRRPMMALALGAEAAAAALFLDAHGVGALYGGRILQGVATGAAVSAAGAALLDLSPPHRPTLGSIANTAGTGGALALAALGAGAVIQYGPAPTKLVFWLLLAASLLALAILAAMPEPAQRRPLHRGVLRPRAGIPPQARRAFAAALPALVASWALGGLYFSLGPSLAEELAHSPNVLRGGLVIFLLTGAGTVANLLFRDVEPQPAMVWGSALLAAGTAATVVTVVTHSAAGFLAASAFTGIGFGTAFLGSFRRLTSLATDEERGALVATIFVVSYLAFGVPVVVAGIVTTHVGLDSTAIGYGIVVSALALLSALAGLRLGRMSERVRDRDRAPQTISR